MERGVTPIFITTRLNASRAGTARNLAKLGLISAEELKFELTKSNKPDHPFHTRLFMKGMPSVSVEAPYTRETFVLANKFMQRVFCTKARGYEIILSVGDNLSDYAEYYGRVFDPTGAGISGEAPTASSRKASVLQDLSLFGRDFVLIPNPTYGGWLSAFEMNRLGSSDELAQTGNAVREPLHEPQAEFYYDDSQSAKAFGPKFSQDNLSIWKGTATKSPRKS